ncbi:MAG: thiamine diphosphokinase [Chloroflexota bacterium]
MSPPREPLHVLIVGSAPADPAQLRQLHTDTQYLICADGGADAVLRAGLTPDLLLGDMDSISPANLDRLRASGMRVVEHRPDKDKTDLELALDTAPAIGATRITIAGALGGDRLDHSLGNLLLLSLPALRGIETRMISGATEALAVWTQATIEGRIGDYVSLFPLTDQVLGVRTEGLRYPLRGETLLRAYTRGVSNELVCETASVSVSDGCLLAIRERRPANHGTAGSP